MNEEKAPEHFKGKSVAEHLKEARKRGAIASGEVHGAEIPGHISASADSAKDTANAFLILWAVSSAFLIKSLTPIFFTFAFGWIIWKAGRRALLGYARLERLNRVIEEERWEIEHHREQEKQELREMYEVKGFTGQLLDQVVDTLIADDNRLLRVMLEEELGLSLEVYEHPLKQAFGAAVGTIISSLLIIFSYRIWPDFGVPITVALLVILCANIIARMEKRNQLTSSVWSLTLSFFAGGAAYFLARLLS